MQRKYLVLFRNLVLSLCCVIATTVIAHWYFHYRQVVAEQKAAQAAAAQQLQIQQRQADITNCENQANLPNEMVLMYDPELNPNAANQIAENDQQCQQEYQ